jgi:hypothetical protein
MEAIRCKDCGDVRWSFFGRATREPGRCSLCGGEMTAERRMPHLEPIQLAAERRGEGPHAPAPTGAERR